MALGSLQWSIVTLIIANVTLCILPLAIMVVTVSPPNGGKHQVVVNPLAK